MTIGIGGSVPVYYLFEYPFRVRYARMSRLAPPRDAVSVIAQKFPVNAPCSVSVCVPAARIRLRPSPERDQIEVDISVTGCSSEKATDILNRMEVGTHQMKDTVRVYSDTDNERFDAEWWRWVRTLDVAIHVDLHLPSPVEAEIRAPGGEVDAANLTGDVDVSVTGGPCRAENMEGTLDIQAHSSDVSILGFSGHEITARVAVGPLTVEDADAETVTVQSVSGTLTLASIRANTTVATKSAPVNLEDISGPCTAHVQGGDLTYEGTPTDDIELRGVGTTIDALLPSDHGATLSMTGARLSVADAFTFEGDRSEHEIEGTLNGGGPSVQLHATGGGAVRCRAG